MEGSSFSSSDYAEERRDLEALLDAFGSRLSLEEIAYAYCKARCGANLAAKMPSELQIGTSTSSESPPNGLSKSEQYLELSGKPPYAEWNSKVSKPRYHPASAGTVSCILGKGYITPKTVANESHITKKPLKLDSKDFPASEIWSEGSSSNSEKEDFLNDNIEDFLSKTIGDGYLLDKDIIWKVLGSCGYNIQKSADTHTEEESPSYVGGNSDGLEPPRKLKGNFDIQQEVLSSLFHFPERSEESSRPVAISKAKTSKAFGRMVAEPLEDTVVEHKKAHINQENGTKEDDKLDNYLMLRKAVMEYRATRKEYYKAAVEALATGNLAKADKLLEEGQFFNRKAWEADEESSQMIFEDRNNDTEDVASLDLQDHCVKDAIRLLKCHLSSLSGIPSIKHLKVTVAMNDEAISKKGVCKRKIVKLLEKESISWTDGGNSGTVLIHLDNINPKSLSFARK